MKKTILFLVLAANLAFATNAIYAQTGEWSVPFDISCFKGFKGQLKNKGLETAVNKYEWVGRIINNYGEDVTFNMYLVIGTEKYIFGQFTLGAKEEKKMTLAQSHYFASSSTSGRLEVDSVCFPSRGKCTAGCYAECDGGTPNQTSCTKEDTAKQSGAEAPAAVDWAYVEAEAKAKAAKKAGSAKVIKGSPSTGVATAKKDGAAKDLNGFASSNTAIKQQIVENLKANIRPVVLERYNQNGTTMTFTLTDVSVQSGSDNVTISYAIVGNDDNRNVLRPDLQYTTGYSNSINTLTATFDQMRSSLEVAGLTGNRFEQTTTFRLLSSVGQFEIKSRAGGGASTGSNTGPGGFLFFDVGNNNANYDALMALLKQLSGTPEPKKEAPSSLAAVKQKILANFMANVRDATYPVMRTGWEREVFTTVSNVNVVATDDAVTFSFRVKFERAADDYWEVKDTVMSFPYADLASPLSFSPQPNVYGNTTSVYLWANATGCNTKYVSTFKGESKHYDRTGQAGCERLPYDAGPSYQNFNELKALAQQLSGAPASAPTQTTANNPVPQTSTRPVVASSGNPAQDGVDQYAAKQYEQAIESFKAAIAKNPKDSGSSFNLGISYYNLKLYAEAVAALKQTIAIKPDWAAAYTELGNALDRSKHPAEAIAAFNKSLQLDPNNFATHYGLGNVQLGLDNRVAAIASYKEAVRIQPNFIACHKLLGTLYRYERLYTESIDSYRDALKINPDDLDVNIELGTTYFIAEQYTESIEVLKKAVEISPKSAKAFTYLGRSYLATKNYDLAISNLKMAVDIDKSDDFPHSLLGEAYCDQKNLPMALKEYNKLVALDSVLRFSLKPQRYPLCHRED